MTPPNAPSKYNVLLLIISTRPDRSKGINDVDGASAVSGLAGAGFAAGAFSAGFAGAGGCFISAFCWTLAAGFCSGLGWVVCGAACARFFSAAAFSVFAFAICCCKAASSFSLRAIRRFRSSTIASVSESLSFKSLFSSLSASRDSFTSASSCCKALVSASPPWPMVFLPPSVGATSRNSGSVSGIVPAAFAGALSAPVEGCSAVGWAVPSGRGDTVVAIAPRASSQSSFCILDWENASSLLTDLISDISGICSTCPRFRPLILLFINASGFVLSKASIICCMLTEVSGRAALAIDQRVSPVTTGP